MANFAGTVTSDNKGLLLTVNPSKEHGKTYNSRQETRGRTHFK